MHNAVITLFNHIGFRYQQPPPLPSDHVPRQSLLDEIKTKLLQATTLPKKCETTLTITGAAGFGKTTTAISLCHDPVIKEHFTDGFLFIELGSKSTDPTVKLKAIYKLLSNEQCDIYAIEQKISQHTSEYHRNLLIIIDDVWHVEDAEPLVKAFSNCTTILTTRMNDIEQYIPCKSSVTIGPMTQSEAVCLLTSRDTDSSKLSREDVSLLDELAQDVHLWPLLLCLIRGQLSHYVKQRRLSYHKAIENVQAKLHQRGLTAFDKNNINIKATKQSRKFAVKFCIEISLELLAKTLSDKLKTLILYGFDTSLQTAVLSNLWNISEVEADDTVNNLWSYGLVQFTDKITDIIISPNNIIQHYVQVHAVISEYIIESIDSNESYALSPHGGISYTAQSVLDGLLLMYQEIYGVDDMKLLTSIDFLKYKLSETESVVIPFYLQSINMHVVMDPLTIIKTLEETKGVLTTSKTLSSSCAEINSLLTDCKQLLNDAYKLCKTLNQRVQRSIHEKSYDKLIQTLEEWIKNYRLFIIAKKADDIINKIISCCNENQKLLHYIRNSQQYLTVFLPEYHQLKTFALPQIKFCINLCQRINGSLLNGSPDVQLTYYYFWSDKCNEDLQSLSENHLSKIQKVAPNIVEKRRLQEQSQSH